MQSRRDRGAARRARRMSLAIAVVVEIPLLIVAVTNADPFGPDEIPVYAFGLAITWLSYREFQRGR
jgi:hypothetical protein